MRYGGLIAAIVFAALAAVVVLKMSGSGDSKKVVAANGASQEIKGINIYVASTPIPVGATITAEMVSTQQWPEHLALPGFMKVEAGENSIIGTVARGSFQQTEPFIKSKLANPNDPNFLAGELPKGMRVVSIPLNEVDGVAGFVFPGDHVDILYTHEIEVKIAADPSEPNSAPTVKARTLTETLLTNVKVLAVDQRASNVGATDSKGNLLVPRSASLMVSQADAQRVRLAQKTGSVSLVLRSIADRESADPMVLTAQKDISQWQESDSTDTSTAEGGIKVVRGAPKTNVDTMKTGTLPFAPPAPPVTPNTVPVTP